MPSRHDFHVTLSCKLSSSLDVRFWGPFKHFQVKWKLPAMAVILCCILSVHSAHGKEWASGPIQQFQTNSLTALHLRTELLLWELDVWRSPLKQKDYSKEMQNQIDIEQFFFFFFKLKLFRTWSLLNNILYNILRKIR